MAKRLIIEQAVVAEVQPRAAKPARPHRAPAVPAGEVEYPFCDGQPMAHSQPQHRTITYATEALHSHFRNSPDVHVRGDMFVYYRNGDPDVQIVPDLMVIRGIDVAPQKSYRIWEVGVVPQFVMEVLSPSTYEDDKGDKKFVYERLGVQEYWLFDPQGGLLDPQTDRRVQGYCLNGREEYEDIPPRSYGCVRSAILELDVCAVDGNLRFWDYSSGLFLRRLSEETEAREREEQLRRQAELSEERQRRRRRVAELDAEEQRRRLREADLARRRDRAEIEELKA